MCCFSDKLCCLHIPYIKSAVLIFIPNKTNFRDLPDPCADTIKQQKEGFSENPFYQDNGELDALNFTGIFLHYSVIFQHETC